MDISARLLLAGLLLLALLTVIAGYSYSEILSLSLPIPSSLTILTILLPLGTCLSVTAITYLVRRYESHPRHFLYLVIFAFQLIYETLIAAFSIPYMIPNCGLEEQWIRLLRSKNENAVKRIQDRYNCCGFNNPLDRAWPFPRGRPEDGFGIDQCVRLYGRTTSCVVPWRQAENFYAQALLGVAITIFAIKFIVLFFQFNSQISWLRLFPSYFASSSEVCPSGRAREPILLDEGDQESAVEQYHDEAQDGEQSFTLQNGGDQPNSIGPVLQRSRKMSL